MPTPLYYAGYSSPHIAVSDELDVGRAGVSVVQRGAGVPGAADAGVGHVAAPPRAVAVVQEHGLALVLEEAGLRVQHYLKTHRQSILENYFFFFYILFRIARH